MFIRAFTLPTVSWLNCAPALALRTETFGSEQSTTCAHSMQTPPPPAEKRRQQNDVGIAIAEAAFIYKVEGDRKYLNAARRYMDAAVSYDIWGYASNKPNVDLAAGHLLYGLAWGYDLLYHDLTEPERTRYRES